MPRHPARLRGRRRKLFSLALTCHADRRKPFVVSRMNRPAGPRSGGAPAGLRSISRRPQGFGFLGSRSAFVRRIAGVQPARPCPGPDRLTRIPMRPRGFGRPEAGPRASLPQSPPVTQGYFAAPLKIIFGFGWQGAGRSGGSGREAWRTAQRMSHRRS